MAEPREEDITFWIGQDFKKVFTFYFDERMKRWRGDWRRYAVYQTGEGVKYEGEAYVSLIESNDSVPGSPTSGEYWAPVARLNLTGYTLTFIVDGVIAGTAPTIVAVKGEATVEEPHASFATPPTSASYRMKVVDPATKTTYPILGTALFRKP
jgi:hypothetical protein